ncbi:hypothetical protein J6Z39_06260 [bacterium]|nr:hypothetical protein [bacterium]MBR6245688.1 hypothetical protein [bacterium]
MKKIIVLLALLLALVGCEKKQSLQDQVDAFIQGYLYAVRDASDGKQGTLQEVYDNWLSSEMKKAVSFDDFKDYATSTYKGKIGAELRTAHANLVIDAETKAFIEATGRTSNMGRMANVMNEDQSLIFTVRVVKEGEAYKVEQQDLMLEITARNEEQARLAGLLKNYKGLIKIDEITGRKIPDRPGMAELTGTILNGSSDLDMIRVGIRVRFKDKNGDVIYAENFLPVTDMRYEGLRTSLLPSSVKVFKTVVKDIPDEWDPDQPLSFNFYLIDGVRITPEELAKENQQRDNLKKLIEDTKKADEEARKQLKEIWEVEKALKEKIKQLQNEAK